MSRILVLDDDPHIVRTLEILLAGDGHEVRSARSGEEALRALEREPVDMALVDLQLPGMSGTAFLRAMREARRDVRAIIITAHGSIETAVEAMKEGAFDYLTKPFSPEQVRHRIGQIERVAALEKEVRGLRGRVGDLPFSGEFVTQSPAVADLLEVSRSVAASDATVLIQGESGSGKTLLARLIHKSSARKEGPFVTLDCTSFQESLLESELFGHKRGSFTGAVSDRQGKVEMADGGTLFLDEVGEVPPHLQGKLLRLVEERAYERVGDPRPRSVDARVIAATHRDLPAMVREREFREDLFFRLSVVDLSIPPLRQRPGDIPLLASAFLEHFCRVHDREVTGWDDEALEAMASHPWPGNVRELAHAIERAVLLTRGRRILRQHLPDRLRDATSATGVPGGTSSLAEVEERHLRAVLARGLPQEETARLLGIDPSTLWRKRKKLGL